MIRMRIGIGDTYRLIRESEIAYIINEEGDRKPDPKQWHVMCQIGLRGREEELHGQVPRHDYDRFVSLNESDNLTAIPAPPGYKIVQFWPDDNGEYYLCEEAVLAFVLDTGANHYASHRAIGLSMSCRWGGPNNDAADLDHTVVEAPDGTIHRAGNGEGVYFSREAWLEQMKKVHDCQTPIDELARRARAAAEPKA